MPLSSHSYFDDLYLSPWYCVNIGTVSGTEIDRSATERERRAKVVCSYVANDEDELTLNPGEVSSTLHSSNNDTLCMSNHYKVYLNNLF